MHPNSTFASHRENNNAFIVSGNNYTDFHLNLIEVSNKCNLFVCLMLNSVRKCEAN